MRATAPGEERLLGEEIEDMTELAALGLEDLCAPTPQTGNGAEPPGLDVEDLAQYAARRSNLTRLVLAVAALGACKR